MRLNRLAGVLDGWDLWDTSTPEISFFTRNMHLPGSFVLVRDLASDPGLGAQLRMVAAVWGGE